MWGSLRLLWDLSVGFFIACSGGGAAPEDRRRLRRLLRHRAPAEPLTGAPAAFVFGVAKGRTYKVVCYVRRFNFS